MSMLAGVIGAVCYIIGSILGIVHSTIQLIHTYKQLNIARQIKDKKNTMESFLKH